MTGQCGSPSIARNGTTVWRGCGSSRSSHRPTRIGIRDEVGGVRLTLRETEAPRLSVHSLQSVHLQDVRGRGLGGVGSSVWAHPCPVLQATGMSARSTFPDRRASIGKRSRNRTGTPIRVRLRKVWAEASDTLCRSSTDKSRAPTIHMETAPVPWRVFEGLRNGANRWTWAVGNGLATHRRRTTRRKACQEQELRPAA